MPAAGRVRGDPPGLVHHRIRAVRPAPVPTAPSAGRADTVRAFKLAWEAKDIDALIGVLSPDATATGDGGGLVRALLHPVVGAEEVARFFAGRKELVPELTLRESTVNGQPGLVAEVDGVPVSVLAFDIAGGRIRQIWSVLNPDKLRLWRDA
ncbi:hypothetical protein [Streptomyces sp. NPDC048002]|uniref:hypothetical protein n=1 Tax=Streptomyces sp. NPDC048002 TaxID=3154344 RepID=UPI0033E54D9A